MGIILHDLFSSPSDPILRPFSEPALLWLMAFSRPPSLSPAPSGESLLPYQALPAISFQSRSPSSLSFLLPKDSGQRSYPSCFHRVRLPSPYTYTYIYIINAAIIVTLIWLLLLAITGIVNIVKYPGIFRAFDPSRAVLRRSLHILVIIPLNFLSVFVRTRDYDILAGVLLAVTGCEALFAK